MTENAPSAFAPGQLPPEVRLLLRCVRWPPLAEEGGVLSTLVAAGDIDWKYFLSLCGHHRVSPLVFRALSSSSAMPPAGTMGTLKRAATQNAISTFAYLAETHRFCDLLQQAGVAVRVLKGVPLSQQAYGDPALRDVGDIDLLIAPEMEEMADRILVAEGFRRNDPEARLTPRRRRSWRKHGKGYTYRANSDDDFEVDLHWRLFRNPHMPGNALADRSSASDETIQLGETALPVLPLDRTFFYLCVHGALDGWSRFKSLIDLAVLWNGFGDEQRNALADTAVRYGILPEMAAALTLAEELELLKQHALNSAMRVASASREAQWILQHARAQHLAQRFEPTQDGTGAWRLKRYELGLRRSFAYRAEIFRRVLLRPRVWQRFDLPDLLFPLYALLSPVDWVLFHRAIAQAGAARTARSRWSRWRALPAAKKRLLVEAFLILLGARGSLSLLPVRWIFRWLGRPLHSAARSADTEIAERIRWAVLSVARYGPISFVCFPQALAAHAMLRRRGISSIMHYGVRRAADRKMRAHTWLEVDHRMLLGGESALHFAPIHSTGSTGEQS